MSSQAASVPVQTWGARIAQSSLHLLKVLDLFLQISSVPDLHTGTRSRMYMLVPSIEMSQFPDSHDSCRDNGENNR